MKPNLFQAVACTLLLVACSPSSLQTGPAKQDGMTQAGLKQGATTPGQADLKATEQGLAPRDKISVTVSLPKSAVAASNQAFGIKSALPAQAAYVRLTIKAVDFSHDYFNTGGITLNGVSSLVAIVGNSATLTVDQLPKGKNRLVIAQVYDADGKELTSFRAMGLFHSQAFAPSGSLRFGDENSNTDIIEQSVSRRNLPLLSMLEQAIDAKNTAFLSSVETHLDQLATEFDKMVYGPNTPGTTFNVDPQRIDPVEIYTDLNNKIQTQAINIDTGLPAYFLSQSPSFIDPLSNVTVFLATPTGFNFTQDLKVQIDDPSSGIVSVTSTGLVSPVSVNLNNITRGTRRLTVLGPTGQLLGHTTVTIDPDTGIAFANGVGSAAGQPLVLLGTETGVSISSVSQAAAIQAVPIILNGVGYSNILVNDIVKFGPNTVAITGATGTTLNLNTPDLIGGTYPITVTRLGIVSNSQNFNILPSITSLSTANGVVGSNVTLTGTGFDPIAANNTVKFGTTNATVTAAAPDGHSLTVTVPAGIWGVQNVTATVGGQLSTEVRPFAVTPQILSLSAASDVIGSPLTVNGTGFDPAASLVKFGTTVATINSATTTQLVVVVPPGIWNANNVTVQVVGSPISNASGFEVIPNITGTSPSAGIPGIFITLNGTGFDPTPGNNAVKFGSIILGIANATVTSASSTSLQVVVFPVIVGNLPVTVQVGNQVSNGSVFQSIFPPAITSFSQNSGSIGTSIQINGSDFDPIAANNVVKFGSTTGTVTAVSGTNQLTVTVPPGIAGTQNVTVQVGANTSGGIHNFAVIPTISGISPGSGIIGSSITMTGTGFDGSMPSNNTVKFGLTPATVTAATSTTLTVTVPNAIGTQDVTVQVGSQINAGTHNYTSSSPVVISSVSPASGPAAGGTTVAIAGTGFTGVTAVNFGGTPAAFVFVSDTQIMATSPAYSGGTVDINVTTPAGTSSNSISDQFNYIVSTGRFYVANLSPGSVSSYGAIPTLTGNIAPTATLTGANTALNFPYGISLDAANDTLYVANYFGTTISVYSPASSAGNSAPTRTISGLTNPHGVLIDTTNNRLYIAHSNGLVILDNALTANGAYTGLSPRTITSYGTVNAYCLALDLANNRLFVSDDLHRVSIFDNAATISGTRAAMLTREIIGASTGLNNPTSLFLNPVNQKLYVASYPAGSVQVFNAATANGNVTPTQNITFGGLASAVLVDVRTDELYVAILNNQIRVYANASTLTGAATATRTISGASTGLNSIKSFALDTSLP